MCSKSPAHAEVDWGTPRLGSKCGLAAWCACEPSGGRIASGQLVRARITCKRPEEHPAAGGNQQALSPSCLVGHQRRLLLCRAISVSRGITWAARCRLGRPPASGRRAAAPPGRLPSLLQPAAALLPALEPTRIAARRAVSLPRATTAAAAAGAGEPPHPSETAAAMSFWRLAAAPGQQQQQHQQQHQHQIEQIEQTLSDISAFVTNDEELTLLPPAGACLWGGGGQRCRLHSPGAPHTAAPPLPAGSMRPKHTHKQSFSEHAANAVHSFQASCNGRHPPALAHCWPTGVRCQRAAAPPTRPPAPSVAGGDVQAGACARRAAGGGAGRRQRARQQHPGGGRTLPHRPAEHHALAAPRPDHLRVAARGPRAAAQDLLGGWVLGRTVGARQLVGAPAGRGCRAQPGALLRATCLPLPPRRAGCPSASESWDSAWPSSWCAPMRARGRAGAERRWRRRRAAAARPTCCLPPCSKPAPPPPQLLGITLFSVYSAAILYRLWAHSDVRGTAALAGEPLGAGCRAAAVAACWPACLRRQETWRLQTRPRTGMTTPRQAPGRRRR